jgi:hypothetical protein
MIPSIQDIENSLGGRPKGDESKDRVSVYLSQIDNEALRGICSTAKMPVSSLVRQLIEEYLSKRK